MADRDKPRLAITMGDPAGVGPEVIVAAWADPRIHEQIRPVVVGHPEILRRAARLRNAPIEVVELSSMGGVSDADSFVPANTLTIPCIRAGSDDVLEVSPGRVDARAGEAAFQAVQLATRLALERRIDGIVTAPLSKAALHAAGHRYPGHTELLAEMCGVAHFAMMLYLPPHGGWLGSNVREPPVGSTAGGSAEPRPQPPIVRGPVGLGVVHVTLHQSLRSVFDDLSAEAIVVKCRLAHDVMRALGASRPRLGVCALNPHAGEDGLFGDEEQTIIAPAVDVARSEGLDVSGPFPTDTLMLRARDGEFDAVVAMYHDQGHIALKLLGMHAAVNVALGLPIVRTSVAHGTAFDKAWQSPSPAHAVRHEGMIAALLTAAKLAKNKRQTTN
jgi:4-hydroxythreonine-4-phosphate dehydrogenase